MLSQLEDTGALNVPTCSVCLNTLAHSLVALQCGHILHQHWYVCDVVHFLFARQFSFF